MSNNITITFNLFNRHAYITYAYIYLVETALASYTLVKCMLHNDKNFRKTPDDQQIANLFVIINETLKAI